MLVLVPVFFIFAVCQGEGQNVSGLDGNPPARVRNALTEKIGNFSIEFLYHTAIQEVNGQNLITSPFTVWTALAVISEGASDNTRYEINRALRLSKNKSLTKRNYGEIAQWLTVKTNTVELAKFNGIFIDKDKLLITQFQETAKQSYDTDIVSLAFRDSELAAKQLNLVISNFTHGRIPNIVEGSNFQNTPMVMASALYFKGQWSIPFNATSTTKQPFFNDKSEEIGQVNMMYNRGTYPFSNIKSLQARVIELPYGKENRLSMLIMMPNYGVSLESMFSNFQKVPLDIFFEELRLSKEEYSEDEVDCLIPRFKIKSDIDLTNVLRDKMGIQDLFDMTKARLPHIARTPLFVSKLIHKAEIEVTEEGTVASAVTVAEFANRIGVLRFEANRPFTYMIVEKITNTIVFGGVYRQPSLY